MMDYLRYNKIECFCCGPYQTNVWVYIEEKSRQCLLVDAAPGSFEVLSPKLKDLELHLFLTHGHWDHIADADLFQSRLHAKIYLHKDDFAWLDEEQQRKIMPRGYKFLNFKPDVTLEGGETFKIAEKSIEIMALPGHTQGQIGIYLKNDACIFVGDTLFKNGFGRTDLFGGNLEMLKKSLEKLSALPAKTTVYPGHGECTCVNNCFGKRKR